MQRNESLIRLRNLLISLAIFVALVFYAATYAVPVLRVSVMPDQPPPVLRRKLKPLTDYLGEKTGIKMEFRPVTSGDALVDALLGHQLDMVWIDGPDLDRARSRSDGRVMPLVKREANDDTPGHDDYTWAVRADMDASLRQKLTAALLALDRHNGRDREILDLQRARRYLPAGR